VALTLDAATAPAPDATAGGRAPRTWDFVRLKLRLLRNGLRGQAWRIVATVVGFLFGLWMALLAAFGLAASGAAPAEVGFVVAAFAGAAVTLGWTLIPLLFFGIDETLDPARFALLPVPKRVLTRGMLAAAFVGVPALVTLIGTAGLAVAAWIRFGPVESAVALVGVVLGLTLGVVASRALTSAFAALLRSRRVRDLAAVIIALLASSVGPLQWVIMSAADRGGLDQATTVARILAWTPFAAPYLLPFDVAEGNWVAVAQRLGMTVAAIVLLAWWWSRTIESAMLGASSGGPARQSRRRGEGAVASLFPTALRRLAAAGVTGAIVARESRYWWREARRRASLVSILMASAVLPIALNVASSGVPNDISSLGAAAFGFAITMSGTMGGMLLGNQFAFDGNAYAAHLLANVPGRVELRARAAALALVALPVQAAVVLAVGLLAGHPDQLPIGFGLLATSFGAAVAAAALLSVLAPYALPESSNPFAMNSGGASAKGLLAIVAMLGTLVICVPVLVVAALIGDGPAGPWVVLALGLGYGAVAAWLGTMAGGRILDRRGPEVLMAVTPRR
jgi:ABC-2 type transport system permease protein